MKMYVIRLDNVTKVELDAPQLSGLGNNDIMVCLAVLIGTSPIGQFVAGLEVSPSDRNGAGILI